MGPVDLTLRPPRAPFSLEKWYVDVLLDDGAVLLVYLGRMDVLGASFRRLTADLFRPGGTHLRGDAPVTHVRCDPDRVVFGCAELTHETLAFDTPGLCGELRYRPRHAPVALRDPFLVDGRRSLTWRVELPDADVEGEVRWPGGGCAVRGRGYRDRVYFDLLPWRFPLRELRWGRAVAGDAATTWVRAGLRRGELRAAWRDGRVLEALEVPELTEDRVMLETHVVDLEGLRLGALRPAMRRLVGDPHEIKWTGRARLDGPDGLEGRSVHEVVRWR